jgi:crossover junction endodeoxyribonuclease RusA
MRIRFILPLPPSVNHQYYLRNGLLTLSNDAQVYKRSLVRALSKIKASGELSMTSICMGSPNQQNEMEGWQKLRCKRLLSMHYEFFLRSIGARDLDNGVKLVQDAICEALGIDDRDVVEIYMAKRVDKENPRLVVTMKLLDFWDATGEGSLFCQPEECDTEFDLLSCVKRELQKHAHGKQGGLSTLEELIKRFNWE